MAGGRGRVGVAAAGRVAVGTRVAVDRSVGVDDPNGAVASGVGVPTGSSVIATVGVSTGGVSTVVGVSATAGGVSTGIVSTVTGVSATAVGLTGGGATGVGESTVAVGSAGRIAVAGAGVGSVVQAANKSAAPAKISPRRQRDRRNVQAASPPRCCVCPSSL